MKYSHSDLLYMCQLTSMYLPMISLLAAAVFQPECLKRHNAECMWPMIPD